MIKKTKRIAFIASMLLITANAYPAAAYAAVSDKDVKIIVRILSYVDGLGKGKLDVLVVSGANDKSKADAGEFLQKANGADFSGVKLNVIQGSVADIQASNAKVVFIPDGMNAEFDQIAEIAKSKQLLTVSNAHDCLDVQKCVVSVSTGARIDILVSQAAALNSNVSFVPAFSMVVKKVP